MSDRIPNEERGEYAISIGGEKYIVRYPLSAMKALDQKFKGFQAKFAKGDVVAADIGYVLYIGLKHGGHGLDEDAVLDMLDMAHLADYLDVLGDALGGKRMQAKAERDAAEAIAAAEKAKNELTGENG